MSGRGDLPWLTRTETGYAHGYAAGRNDPRCRRAWRRLGQRNRARGGWTLPNGPLGGRMMGRFKARSRGGLRVLGVALAAVAFTTAATAAEPALRWKFTEGDSLHYQ